MSGLAITALAILAAASSGPGSSARPLHLKVKPAGDQMVIELVGSSPLACEVEYVLEVSSGPGNRSVNRGKAAFQPGKTVTIATVRVNGPLVTARLNVSGCAGNYSESWRRGA